MREKLGELCEFLKFYYFFVNELQAHKRKLFVPDVFSLIMPCAKTYVLL